ncbi:MAG: prephenate dehydrogenase/arogenate dehydrogenase family protein [Candidatus Thermoplasmatota archaeon]|nr:prephenate dehydrogenase/arogenate dehydrogenase family protein [Candidatus Thermoplasmatota archaeon]MCL5789818.1 prephenate dehydrogenase/arogenate dehydrogenase family protein [Candidatus Thermoplasmatota archaeon]
MRCAIVGIGRMGRWLANVLKEEWDIAVYDTEQQKTEGITGVKVLQSVEEIEVFRPNILINAVTLGNTIRVFEEVVPFLPEECILADITSIKGELQNYYQKSGHRYVSSHPMFGPTNANMKRPDGESAIIIKESSEEGKKIFREIYSKIKLNLYEFTFSEHDSMMAYSLTLPFSSSMVFAGCVDRKAVPGTNFRKHMELAKGILSEDDSLLSEILFNPESIKQLERITSKLEFLKHIIMEKDYEEAGKFYDRLRDNIFQ